MNTDRNPWKGRQDENADTENDGYFCPGFDGHGVRRSSRLGATGAAGPGSQQLGRQVGRLDVTLEHALEIQIQPDGSYTSVRGTTTGQGTITMVGGRLMADGHLVTGPNVAVAGAEKTQLTLSSKAGKQVLSGTGRDNEGPYSFQLTKQ
jgi:hypothetical protein